MQTAAEAIAAAALIAAPLALGLVHLQAIVGVSVLGWLALILLVAGRRGRPLRLGWFSLSLLAFSAVFALQLLPLPFPLLRLLAPATGELVELTLGADPGARPLTLDLGATSAALVKALGFSAVAAVLQHRSASASGGRKRVRIYLVAATAAVAVLGFGHFLVGERQSFLGLYDFRSSHHFRTSFGNSNHLAGFLSLGGLLSLGLAIHSKTWRARLCYGAVFLGASAGTILSASRGGFGGWLAGMLILPILGWGAARRREGGEREGWKSLLTLGGAAILVTLLSTWIYVEFPRALREIETLFSLSPENEAGKVEAAATAWNAAKSHWLLGIGRGAFESAGTRYQLRPFPGTWFTHAENEPLQALAELGIPLGVALVGVFAAAWLSLAARGRRSWAEAGAAAGMLALCLQNLVDFGLQGAGGLAVAALAATSPKRPLLLRSPFSLAVAALGTVLLAMASWAAFPGLEAENQALLASTEGKGREEVEGEVRKALARRPADWVPVHRMAAFLLHEEGDPGAALPWINRRLLLFPQDGRGQSLAGEALAAMGRHRQARSAFRAAADLGVSTIERVAELYDDPAAILEAAPTLPKPANVAAQRLSRLGKPEAALAIVAEGLRRSPDDLPLLKTLQGLHVRRGDKEEALALARRLRGLEPGDASSFTREAEALLALGRVEEARSCYLQGLEEAGKARSLVFGLASLELGQKRGEEGIRALDLLPPTADRETRVRYHTMRGQAFRLQGSMVRARDEYRVASGLAPERPQLRIALADVLGDLARFEEARKELAALDSASPQAAAAMKRLEEKRRRYQEERGLNLERLLR